MFQVLLKLKRDFRANLISFRGKFLIILMTGDKPSIKDDELIEDFGVFIENIGESF
jgi:hypothetical protein